MSTVFTNEKVSITKCIVFGLSVLSEDGNWYPLDQLDKEDFLMVDGLIDNNPTFPWKSELQTIRKTFLEN